MGEILNDFEERWKAEKTCVGKVKILDEAWNEAKKIRDFTSIVNITEVAVAHNEECPENKINTFVAGFLLSDNKTDDQGSSKSPLKKVWEWISTNPLSIVVIGALLAALFTVQCSKDGKVDFNSHKKVRSDRNNYVHVGEDLKDGELYSLLIVGVFHYKDDEDKQFSSNAEHDHLEFTSILEEPIFPNGANGTVVIYPFVAKGKTLGLRFSNSNYYDNEGILECYVYEGAPAYQDMKR